MYAENGRVPFVDKLVGAVLVGAFGVGREVFVPVGIIILPVAEPVLLSIGIHRLEVEGTVVGDKGLEAFVVMAGKVVDREASERGANGCHAVAVDIREIVGGIIDGREIVVDALAGPVARNGLTPLMAETGQATTVGGNHHIALRGHDHEVPTVAPELADRTLRTAFAEEQGGIFLGLVEIWR